MDPRATGDRKYNRESRSRGLSVRGALARLSRDVRDPGEGRGLLAAHYLLRRIRPLTRSANALWFSC